MTLKRYTPYSSFYKLKEGVNLLPEYRQYLTAKRKGKPILYSSFFNSPKSKNA